jgi:hypothetical protein
MPTEVSGLPAHILLVHIVIVLVPVAAVLVVVAGVWPAARRWLNWLPALASLGALVAVPITTNAGHWLENHLRGDVTPAIKHHANLGDQMLPWVLALFVASLAVWGLAVVEGHRTFVVGVRAGAGRNGARTASSGSTVHASTGTTEPSSAMLRAVRRRRLGMRVAVAVLALVAGIGAVQQVYRTGEAGSRAVWTGSFNS